MMPVGFGLLVATGVISFLAGALLIALSSGRSLSLLAGAVLLLVGLQHLGWARAADALSWGQKNYWLDLSIVFTLPVTLAWLFLSVTLGRANLDEQPYRAWRVYIAIQAILSLGALIALHWFSPAGRKAVAGDSWAVPLTAYGSLLLGNWLLNLTLMLASFEATYLAFSARWRREFRPAFLSIILATGSSGALIATSVLKGRFSLWEVSLASVPTGIVALLLPLALLRSRIVEATVTGPTRPIYETACFVIGLLVSGSLVALAQVMRWTGWTLPRASWVFIACAALVGVAAVAVSNRLQRLLQRLIEAYLYGSSLDREAIWTRLARDLDGAASAEDLFRLITAKAAEIGRVSPVTLFIRYGQEGDFDVVGSTIAPRPDARVGRDEPLARELRAIKHAISLQGHTYDLDHIPIYVENAKQIAACEAVCAIPLMRRGQLAGFLLCGNPEGGGAKLPSTLPVLEVVAQVVTTRLTSSEHGR